MASFPSLRLARRPVRTRVLVVHRVAREAAGALLPGGLVPREFEGCAVLLACYTRLGPPESALLPHRRSSTHHLDYRIVAERAEVPATPVTFVARRETSSLFGARWNETILRREQGRSRFEVESDAFRQRLTVTSARREELRWCVELADQAGALFGCPKAVQELLEGCGDAQPHDVLAPETDRIDARNAFVPEPLTVLELRSAFLDEHFDTQVEVDGAWRLVSRRSAPVRGPRTNLVRPAISGGQAPAT